MSNKHQNEAIIIGGMGGLFWWKLRKDEDQVGDGVVFWRTLGEIIICFGRCLRSSACSENEISGLEFELRLKLKYRVKIETKK